MTYKQSGSCQIATLASIYEQVFGYKTKGTFVDVGAHDGYSFSNTWGLAEAGWGGLCFEPVPALYEKCKSLYWRKKVRVVQSCIGDVLGTARLFLGENPTIDIETMQKSPWGGHYEETSYIDCLVTTLDRALKLFSIPKEFDVLNIDVEGAELKVLAGFTWQNWMPKLIIIEDHDGHAIEARRFHADAIRDWFAATPYKRIYTDTLNSIYEYPKHEEG